MTFRLWGMLSQGQPHQTTSMMTTWTLLTGSMESRSSSCIKSQQLKKMRRREKWLCCSCRGFYEAEPSRISCMKEKKKDSPWLNSFWSWPRFRTFLKTKPNKFYWISIKKSSETPCMKGFRVKWSPKHSMNSQRNSWGTLRKNAFGKKSKRLRNNVVSDKYKRQVAEMPSRSSVRGSSVYMSKLWKWTKEQWTVTWTGLSTILSSVHLIGRRVSWPTYESKRWISTCKVTKEGSITIRR